MLNTEHVDKIISAEISTKEDPTMRNLVIFHKIHAPSRSESLSAICMNDDCFTDGLPKRLRKETAIEDEAVSQYYVMIKFTSPGHVVMNMLAEL